MDVNLDFTTVNWLATLAAAFVGFAIGGAWYSPAVCGRFLPQFMAAVESRTGASPNIAGIFMLTFILLWASASFMAGLLGPTATAWDGMNVGLAIGLFIVFPPLIIATLFGSRPIRLMIITGGYFVVGYGVMGLILGAL